MTNLSERGPDKDMLTDAERIMGDIGPRTDAERMTTWAWVNYLQAITPAEREAWGRAYEALSDVRAVSRVTQDAEATDHALS